MRKAHEAIANRLPLRKREYHVLTLGRTRLLRWVHPTRERHAMVVMVLLSMRHEPDLLLLLMHLEMTLKTPFLLKRKPAHPTHIRPYIQMYSLNVSGHVVFLPKSLSACIAAESLLCVLANPPTGRSNRHRNRSRWR